MTDFDLKSEMQKGFQECQRIMGEIMFDQIVMPPKPLFIRIKNPDGTTEYVKVNK